MKKRFLVTKMLALVLGSMLIFTACGETKEEAKDDKEAATAEEENSQEIELSEKKVNLEVGDAFDIEIENYDDLKKVKIEVEDEDIVTAELDEEIITLVAISEGKTTLTVSAKGCEDVSVTVKVKEGEGGSASAAAVEPGRYVATYAIPDEVWEDSMGEDAEIFLDLFGNQAFAIDFIMDIESDGTAVLSADYDKFVNDFIDWLDVNYLDVMKKAVESEGEEWSDDYEDYLLENKDLMMDNFRDSMETSMTGSDSELADLTWEQKGDVISFTGDNGDAKECIYFDDGSFILSLTAEELGEDMFGDSMDLYFWKS